MNKRFAIAWIVVFCVWMGGSFLVHNVMLSADYARVQNLFRTPADAQQYFALMILAHVLMSGALTWIYARGVDARPWLPQGLRFGVAAALLTAIPWYMIYFVVQPMPGATVAKQIVYDGILVILLGVVAAYLYRDARRA